MHKLKHAHDIQGLTVFFSP